MTLPSCPGKYYRHFGRCVDMISLLDGAHMHKCTQPPANMTGCLSSNNNIRRVNYDGFIPFLSHTQRVEIKLGETFYTSFRLLVLIKICLSLLFSALLLYCQVIVGSLSHDRDYLHNAMLCGIKMKFKLQVKYGVL